MLLDHLYSAYNLCYKLLDHPYSAPLRVYAPIWYICQEWELWV